MQKKPFIQRVETRRAILTGLLVAFFVLCAEAMKSTVEFVVSFVLKQSGINDTNFSTAIGFFVAGLFLIIFIYMFSDLLEK